MEPSGKRSSSSFDQPKCPFLSSWRISFPLILRNFLLRDDRQAVVKDATFQVFASFFFVQHRLSKAQGEY